MRARPPWWSVAAALALVGCTAPVDQADGVKLMVADAGAPQWEALMSGEITVDPSGCVLLGWDGAEAPLLVVWPAGTERVSGDPGGVRSSRDGELSFAEPVELGGGERFGDDDAFFGAHAPPEGCAYDGVFLVSGW